MAKGKIGPDYHLTLRQMWYLLKFSFYPLCTKTFNIVTILDVKGLLQGLGHERTKKSSSNSFPKTSRGQTWQE